jgi:hypothetical protein
MTLTKTNLVNSFNSLVGPIITANPTTVGGGGVQGSNNAAPTGQVEIIDNAQIDTGILQNPKSSIDYYTRPTPTADGTGYNEAGTTPTEANFYPKETTSEIVTNESITSDTTTARTPQDDSTKWYPNLENWQVLVIGSIALLAVGTTIVLVATKDKKKPKKKKKR